MKINPITTNDIPKKNNPFNEKYGQLFSMALSLNSGNGFSVIPDDGVKPGSVANCVRGRLKKVGIVDKYIIAVREGTLYICKK